MTQTTDLLGLNETAGHPIDRAKVEALAESIERDGWVGAPILTYGGMALTGTHRLEAAREIGLDVPTLDLTDITDDADAMVESVAVDNSSDITPQIAAAVFAVAVGPERADELGLDLDIAGIYTDALVSA